MTTIITDCLNCQYRIVDNTLFYLTLEHEQSDASTESFYIRGKQLDLSDYSEWSFPNIVTGQMKAPLGDSYYGTHNPTDFYVVISDNRCILGYVYETDSNIHSVCYDITPDGEIAGAKWLAHDSGTVKTFNQGDSLSDTDFWQVLYPMEDGSRIFFMGRSSGADTFFSRTYSVSVEEWPDITNAELTPIQGGRASNGYSWSSLRCVADNKLFYDCHDGLCYYDILNGSVTKINNDKPTEIQFVGDNKVYYSWYDKVDKFYCCDLEGKNWRELNW